MEKEYDKYYYVSVCPYCNHSKVIQKPQKFFDWNTVYRCSKCSREFGSKSSLSVVPEEKVKNLVQDGLNGKISQDEMIKGFKSIGIFIYKPFKK